MPDLAFVVKDPDKAYLGTQLWLPKKYINSHAVKASLEFTVAGEAGQEFLQLWEDAGSHLAVPREYIKNEDYAKLTFPIVDLTPQDFPRTSFRSRVVLDQLEPKEDTQRKAFKAMSAVDHGILNLACVAGDTELCLNRGGKGFKTTIEKAYERSHGLDPHSRNNWDHSIPTLIRSNQEGRIGLQQVLEILYRGKKLTTKITLEDGKTLRLTRDNEVLTTRGWVQTQYLFVNDSIIIDGEREVSVRKKKRAYKRFVIGESHPYARPQRYHKQFVCYVIEVHRATAEAELNDMSLEEFRKRCMDGNVEGLRFIDPSKFHVHHMDEDIHNNDPTNLEVCPKADHLGRHRPGYKAFGYGVPTPVKLVKIECGKFEKVYDVVCAAPHHNFVANGIVIHNCGKGKTTLALHHIAKRGLNALIIVNQTTILDQWEKAIQRFLEFDGGVGRIQGDPEDWDWERPITIAMLHTLARYPDAVTPAMRRHFGIVIWDEVHHLSAPYFCITSTMFPGQRYGLSATVHREDGTEVIYNYHVGDPFYKDLMQTVKPTIRFRQTPFFIPEDDYVKIITDKSGNTNVSKLRVYVGAMPDRNEYIALDLLDAVRAGRKVLALSHSKDQLKLLHAMFQNLDVDCGICTGDQKVAERWRALREKQIIFGTHQLVMEAIDEDSLDTLFWLTPFGSNHPDGGKNALQQGMGRIQGYRFREGMKQPLVVIFDDLYIKQFHKMCNKLRLQMRRWPTDEGGPYDYTTLKPRGV